MRGSLLQLLSYVSLHFYAWGARPGPVPRLRIYVNGGVSLTSFDG